MIQTPYLTTDGIIKLHDKQENFLGLVFIERLNEPHGIALPGGFVDIGENVEDALKREMKEEVSLDVQIEYLLNIYSDPQRDPRFHTASATFVCKSYGTPKAADDAKNVFVYDIHNIPFEKLVFDHKFIIEDFLKKENEKFCTSK